MTVLVAFAAALAVGGVAFGYWVILPAAVHFLTSYDSSHFNIIVRARDYYAFTSFLLLAVALAFEVPVFVLGLVRLRILSAARLRASWRMGIFAMTALGVLLPGVDPVSTALSVVTLITLYAFRSHSRRSSSRAGSGRAPKRRRMSDAGVWLRLTAALGALAFGVAAVVIVVVLAHRTPGPAGATNTPTPEQDGSAGDVRFPSRRREQSPSVVPTAITCLRSCSRGRCCWEIAAPLPVSSLPPAKASAA
jgi:hypothetical protein